MSIANVFQYQQISQKYNNPRYALMFNGHQIAEDIFNHIDAQFKVGSDYVVICTTEAMHSEILQAYLVSEHGKILDSARYTGWFTAFEVLDSKLSGETIMVSLSKGIRIQFTIQKSRFLRKKQLQMTPILP